MKSHFFASWVFLCLALSAPVSQAQVSRCLEMQDRCERRCESLSESRRQACEERCESSVDRCFDDEQRLERQRNDAQDRRDNERAEQAGRCFQLCYGARPGAVSDPAVCERSCNGQ